MVQSIAGMNFFPIQWREQPQIPPSPPPPKKTCVLSIIDEVKQLLEAKNIEVFYLTSTIFTSILIAFDPLIPMVYSVFR